MESALSIRRGVNESKSGWATARCTLAFKGPRAFAFSDVRILDQGVVAVAVAVARS